MPLPFPILFEDYYLLAVDKPAGLIVEIDSRFPSVALYVANYFRERHPRSKNPFTGIVHRIDRPVSGVLLIAKTKQALLHCARQFESRDTIKKYTALITGKPNVETGTLQHWLEKDHQHKKAIVRDHPTLKGKECRLTYQVTAYRDGVSRIDIHLLTGRYHQIRAQFAHMGHPILGDTLYGNTHSFRDNTIALHAASLAIQHPKSGENLVIHAPLPAYFNNEIRLG